MNSQDIPNFALTGQVALITGAGRGLGRAIALAMAHAGADIALGLRDVNTAADLEKQIAAMSRKVLRVQMDVTSVDQIRQAVAAAEAHFGRIDILVNNAGIALHGKPEDVREEDYDRVLALNVKGTYFASQAAGRGMIRRKHGRIINLSSQAGVVALPYESVYCITKAAIAHMTKCLAVEWGPHHITVNSIAPTFFHTPGTKDYLADPAHLADVVSRIALGRVGEPVEVAGAAVFLASPAAAMITGANLLIDGGWTAR